MRKFISPLLVILVLGGSVYWGVERGRAPAEEGFQAAPAETEPAVQQPSLPTPEEIAEEESEQSAEALFGHACGTCHTLSAAGTTAPIGPNLDRLKLTKDGVLARIRTGSLDGAMPANLLTGRSAERVAAYVARVAGSQAGSGG